ncbi:hypothetical protein KCP75_01765 [Salmonella enterica subsp. enterica]|nr:hypothetical protein KCP75_01765 [Salmonella enterica subsp. enterica]
MPVQFKASSIQLDAMQEIAARRWCLNGRFSTGKIPSIAASNRSWKALEIQLRDLIDKRNARAINPRRFQRPLSSAPGR